MDVAAAEIWRRFGNMVAGGGVGARRNPPIVSDGRFVARERVVGQLAERFSHRVTTLVAHAGSGKTAALALAIDANRLDPWGRDVWVALDDRDDAPDQLLGAITDAVGASTGGTDPVGSIVDAIWSSAPEDVAIILDDVHVVTEVTAVQALSELIRRLPANGHVVLSSRTMPTVPLARLRAQFEVLDLDAGDLALDAAEADALVALRCGDAAAQSSHELPRVAAIADLTLRFGASAGADFLWDEVLASFAPNQLEMLRRMALVGVVDGDLAAAVVSSTGADLDLDGIALVDRDDTGRFVMHDLLRTALLGPLSTGERERLAAATARDAGRSTDRSLAVMLLVEAGEHELASSAARAFIMTATLRRTIEQIERVCQVIERVDRTGPIARFLRAELRSGQRAPAEPHASQAAEFGDVADAARATGDDEVEAAACYRCHQQTLLELLPVADDRIERLAELAPTVPYAAQVLRFARASQHLRRGDSASAWAEIVELGEVADEQSEQVFRAGLMCLLGRFDEVVAEFGPRDASSLAPGVDEYVAYALYLSGSVTPEVAAPMFEDLSEGIGRAQLAQTSVVLFTTGALISLHVGDHELAEVHLRAARDVVRSGCAPSFAVNVDTAGAVAALAVDGEDEARRVLDESFNRVRLGEWPTAAHLTVLPMIWLWYPESRERLAACEFGRPSAVALDAGRALAALREDHDVAPAVQLPWGELDLLRVQVPPPLLAELAAVAAISGRAEAAAAITTIPHVDRWLRRCARGEGPGAESAAAVLSSRPRVPDVPLRIRALGALEVERGGLRVEHPDLQRRGRVQQLLGLLAERRSVVRTDAAEALWPELDARAASNNLRVTLSYLNRALEPDREPEDPPIYVTQRGETIGLHPEVTSDVDEFRHAVRNGRGHARRRSPRAALDAYRQAAELYRGDYLAGQDANWLATARTRLRFDAVHTFLRLGELHLASGEPEEAVEWGLRARQLGGTHDRVERLLAGSQLATGDRAGAAATLRTLVASLRADGVAPEADTLRMLGRITA